MVITDIIELSIDIEETDIHSEPVDLDIPEEIEILLDENDSPEIVEAYDNDFGISLAFNDDNIKRNTSDTTGPTISDFVLQENGQTLTIGDTIHVSVKVEDESEISSVTAFTTDPIATFTYNKNSGRWEWTYTFSERNREGTFKIESLWAYDEFGNRSASIYPTESVKYIDPDHQHTPVTDPAVAPTCTETGLTEGSHCSVCGKTLTAQQVVPAKGHTPVTDKAVAATCTKSGLTEGSHCSVCNAILTAQQTVPAKGHTPVTDPAVAPTLTQTGLTEGSHCSVCGQVLVKQKVIPKLISIKKCSITGISDKVYAAKAFKPAPVVKYQGKTLKKDTDYTVSYKDNKNVGTATVTITGKGKYGASINKTFKINPKPVALVSLTPGSKQLTVKWKKGANINGYEVQYSLKKSFASAKKVSINKAGTVQTVLKKLTANKTYYVRVRTYKTVKGKKYYSTWSKAKSAKPTK